MVAVQSNCWEPRLSTQGFQFAPKRHSHLWPPYLVSKPNGTQHVFLLGCTQPHLRWCPPMQTANRGFPHSEPTGGNIDLVWVCLRSKESYAISTGQKPKVGRARRHVVEVQGHEHVVGDPQRLDGVLPAQDQMLRCHQHRQSQHVPRGHATPIQIATHLLRVPSRKLVPFCRSQARPELLGFPRVSLEKERVRNF